MTANHSDTCIFCKIIKGDIPCAKVFENEHVLAFLDIGQVTKGHTLVIPKVHKKDIHELTPDIAATLFSVVPSIANAIEKAYQPVGLNILNNNGAAAGQSVFHYHMHLIPRYGKEDGFSATWNTNEKDFNPTLLGEVANTIAKNID